MLQITLALEQLHLNNLMRLGKSIIFHSILFFSFILINIYGLDIHHLAFIDNVTNIKFESNYIRIVSIQQTCKNECLKTQLPDFI